MADVAPRHIDIESLRSNMRPSTDDDDDVPMTSDWQPLDTEEKLLEFLTQVNEARERARVS